MAAIFDEAGTGILDETLLPLWDEAGSGLPPLPPGITAGPPHSHWTSSAPRGA